MAQSVFLKTRLFFNIWYEMNPLGLLLLYPTPLCDRQFKENE